MLGGSSSSGSSSVRDAGASSAAVSDVDAAAVRAKFQHQLQLLDEQQRLQQHQQPVTPSPPPPSLSAEGELLHASMFAAAASVLAHEANAEALWPSLHGGGGLTGIPPRADKSPDEIATRVMSSYAFSPLLSANALPQLSASASALFIVRNTSGFLTARTTTLSGSSEATEAVDWAAASEGREEENEPHSCEVEIDGADELLQQQPGPSSSAVAPSRLLSSAWTNAGFAPFDGVAFARALSAIPHFAASVEAVVVQCDPQQGACAARTILSADPPRLVLHLHARPRGGGRVGSRSGGSVAVALQRVVAASAVTKRPSRAAPAATTSAPAHRIEDSTAVDSAALAWDSTVGAARARDHMRAAHRNGSSSNSSSNREGGSRSGSEGGEEWGASSDLFLDVAPAHFGPLLTSRGLSSLRFRLASPLNACSPLLNTTTTTTSSGSDGCSPSPTPRGRRPYAVLVARGDCTFAAKARHAQAAGAAAVLVLDVDAPDFHATADAPPASPPANPPAPFNFVMADDGSGSDIFVPVGMLGGLQSRLLLQALGAGLASATTAQRARVNLFGQQVTYAFDVGRFGAEKRDAQHALMLRRGASLRGCFFSSSGGGGGGGGRVEAGGTPTPRLLPHPNRILGALLPHMFGQSQLVAAARDRIQSGAIAASVVVAGTSGGASASLPEGGRAVTVGEGAEPEPPTP